MGLEGQLAHAWFVLLAHSLPYQWKFAGRNRRPPRDPVNALLSLSYTLLSSEIHQLVIASGLDPSLGFLHQDTPGRESLMLDFMEIFRSGVDSFVLQWLAESELDESSFYYREEEGCRLSKQLRPLFFKAWSQQRYQWSRPLIEALDDGKWLKGEIRGLVNGQIMRWREQL
jgi:CRISPR-associated protein Cas1